MVIIWSCSSPNIYRAKVENQKHFNWKHFVWLFISWKSRWSLHQSNLENDFYFYPESEENHIFLIFWVWFLFWWIQQMIGSDLCWCCWLPPSDLLKHQDTDQHSSLSFTVINQTFSTPLFTQTTQQSWSCLQSVGNHGKRAIASKFIINRELSINCFNMRWRMY